MPDATDKPKPPRPVVPPPDMKALAASRANPPAKGAGAAPKAPAVGSADVAGTPAHPPPVVKKAASELLPHEIAALRLQIVDLLKERKRSGQPVTMTVEHKEFAFTGRVIRVEADEGYAILENADGRRRGCWFILGGKLTANDGAEIDFPVDGVAR